jgi:vitamin B12 transporter
MRFTYNLRYTRLQSEGFSSAEDVTGNKDFDKDGYGQDVCWPEFICKCHQNWKLGFFGQYGKYKTDLDDASFTDDKNNVGENKNLQAGITSLYNFNKGSFNCKPKPE